MRWRCLSGFFLRIMLVADILDISERFSNSISILTVADLVVENGINIESFTVRVVRKFLVHR